MRCIDFAENIDSYFANLSEKLRQIDRGELNDAMNAMLEAYDRDADIYVFGNGGSASTASHMMNDFNKGISLELEKKFRFHCLDDNVSTLSAIANDYGYEKIFLYQLEGRLRPEDLVVAISGSGNSKNVIAGVEYARNIGCKVIGISGYDGGKLYKLADFHMHVPCNDMQVVEDAHMIFNHMMMKLFSSELKEDAIPVDFNVWRKKNAGGYPSWG